MTKKPDAAPRTERRVEADADAPEERAAATDLNATVALNADALAALLEQVKQVQQANDAQAAAATDEDVVIPGAPVEHAETEPARRPIPGDRR